MPLTDRQDFKTWFDNRNQGMIGRSHGNCIACGSNLDHQLDCEECLVCLAERFGTETAELWLAEAISGVVHAAADPLVLPRLLAELIKFARELTEHHASPPTVQD